MVEYLGGLTYSFSSCSRRSIQFSSLFLPLVVFSEFWQSVVGYLFW